MDTTYEKFEGDLLSERNQWKKPYKYLVLKKLLENYPQSQKKDDIVNSSETLTKAKELNIQSFWSDLLTDGYCEDLEYNDRLTISVEDLTEHQKDHLLKICKERIDGIGLKKISLSSSCIEIIEELSGLNRNEFASEISISNCTKILHDLQDEDPNTRQVMIERLKESLKKSEKIQAEMENERMLKEIENERKPDTVEDERITEEYQEKTIAEPTSKENIEKQSEPVTKVPLPTEYRTLNITDDFNRVKRNEGLKSEDFKNIIFKHVRDKDKERLRNHSVSIKSLIFDLSEGGSIRLFGIGELVVGTVIQNRQNRSKKDEISVKIENFSSFSNNDEAMPIIPELKNIGLKKYFNGIVNYVDSVETFHKLTDDVETTPSKNPESKTIPEVVDKQRMEKITKSQVRFFINSLDLKNTQPYASVLKTFRDFSNKHENKSFEQILDDFLVGKSETSIQNQSSIIKNFVNYTFNQKIQRIEAEHEAEHEAEPDPALIFPKNIEDKIKEIQKDILVDKDIIYQIASNLIAGKNILLVGPVGSGKTNLSQKISKILWRDEEFEGFFSKAFTAHSEWTIADVIGGIAPEISKDDSEKVKFRYNPGCVVETVLDNWVDGDSDSNIRKVLIDDEGRKYRGTWLLIDEFNRANIDKSFGEMFTAIEYGKLSISDNRNNKLTRELKIPRDYRIIGTLNSTDKHFLTELSNALKRRFAMIEISYPKYEEKDSELYHAIKKSLRDLDLPEIEESLDHQKQKYSQNNDVEIDKIIENLYNIIFFVRQMKPLGTSIFIGILKTFFTEISLRNTSTKDELEKILDNCLRSQLLPQFEDLKTKQIELLKFFFSRKRLSGFHKKHVEDGGNSSDEEFRNIANFIGAKTEYKPGKLLKALHNENLGEMQSAFQYYWAEKDSSPNMKKTVGSLEEMLKERGVLEEEEFEDSPNEA